MNSNSHSGTTPGRWLAFNLVGVTGVAVQLTALTWLLWTGMHYMAATALAVEAAILNNFIWHERWTWLDRTQGRRSGALGRLVRFNATIGIVSITENLVFMKLLVGYFAIHHLLGNVVSIAACSLINFFLSDRLVFRRAS